MDHRAASSEDIQETALVQRAQAGDRSAFDRLARHYRPALRALAFLRTGDLQEAEDLAQVVLTRAWQNLSTLQEPAAFLTWLKTIVANACNSWYRRSRFRPNALSTEPDALLVADHCGMPLEALLARERERELRKALIAIPDANRLALMLHVWGDYSYEEIARFAGVQVTTVEGRIYRARQQLRRLLRDEGAEFLGEPHRRHAGDDKERRRRKIMTATTIPADAQEIPRPLALVLFTRQFSELIDCGISLVRTLLILEEAPAPYGEAAKNLRVSIEGGECLSRMMANRPELFPNFYCVLIRAGEVGGMLEETLRKATQLMTQEWQLARRRPRQEEFSFFTLPSSRPQPQDWAALSAYQRSATLALFCETLSLLLVSGVPILQAMDTLSALLPLAQKTGWMQAYAAVKKGERIVLGLERMGIFPRFVIELVALGEQTGTLDRTLHRAAEIFEHELECRIIED